MVLAVIEILMIVGALCCFILSARAFMRHGAIPKTVAVLCISAGAAMALSLDQIVVGSEQVMRVVDIFFFLSVDFLMFSLYSYAAELVDTHTRAMQSIAVAFGILIAADAVLSVFNVFEPCVTAYTPLASLGLDVTTGFARNFLPLFDFHMGLDYLMGCASAVLFCVKIYQTPNVYRGPYVGLMAALVIVYAVDVLYMSDAIDSTVDCSCMIYAVAVLYLYWVTFYTFRSNQCDQVIKTVVQGSRGPMVCFADNGCLAVMNAPARELFDVHDNYWDPMTLEEFSQEFGMPDLSSIQESLSFIWSPDGSQIGGYFCEFSVVNDERGRCVGYGITMHKATDIMDNKTGLYNEESFRSRREDIQQAAAYPTLFTNVSLSYVNAMNDAHGRSLTDASIGNFARWLEDYWPAQGKNFIAYRGASEFEVISQELSSDDIRAALDKLAEEIVWNLPEDIKGDFEYGIMEADGVELDAIGASRAAHELCMYKLFGSPDSVRSESVSSLVRPLIDRGFTTQGRMDATSRLAGSIAKSMGVDETTYWRCVLLARLSDIGKLAVPDDVAFHAGPFTRGARMLMERHAEVGYRLLKSVTGLSALSKPLLHHHENWDGTGYPDNLKGEQIPLESRITAVATAFDDMVNDQDCALSFADAIEEIASGAGTLFDPDVVKAFLLVAGDGENLTPAAKTTLLRQVQNMADQAGASAQGQEGAGHELTVLVVDDKEENRHLIAINLADKYKCIEAANGQEALELITDSPGSFDVVLLDLYMPVLDGKEVLKRMHEARVTEEIPFIVVTADNGVDTWRACLDTGAVEVLRKPVDGDILRRCVDNAIELFSTRKSLQLKVERQSVDIMIKNEKLRAHANRLMRANEQVSNILHNVMDYRDCDSAGHLDRVMGYTMALAQEVAESCPSLGITRDQVNALGQASALHDIGKVAVPDSILFKVGKLTDDEFAVMEAHTVCGYNLIREPLEDLSDDDFARFSLEVVRSHHERWDGSGYPDGLKEREIPVSAQITALADVYDALTSKRPYKGPCSHEEAVQTILSGGCGVFSNVMMSVFEKVSPSFPQIAAQFSSATDLNLGTEYRERLVRSYGDLGNEGVVIDNGSSMEHMVRTLMDANRDLNLLNQYDLPTGAFNRNAYVEYLRKFNSTSLTCMAAIYFDVNGLHEYNRDFGHAQGDVMLANVVRAIMDVFVDFKTFRTGGDEFVTVCENATEEQTIALVEKVKALFEERGLSCSVGYDWRQSDIDMDEMVKAADRSMFAQKEVYYEQNPHANRR